MLETITPKIRAFILDMDGVLWKGNQSIGDLPSIFTHIASRNIAVIFATNNSTRDALMYINKLNSFGVSASPQQIVNSPMATLDILRDHFPCGGPVYIIGEKGLFSTLELGGYYFSEDNALAVVAGMDRHVTYQKLSRATQLIRSGALFIGTNPDLTYPTPNGIMPGAGAILAAIEAASGIKPLIAGKPASAIFQLSLERLGTRPDETLVIGDRFETDILGGHAAGCRTALMLSGVSSIEEAANWQPEPDIVAENLSMLLGIDT